MMRATLESMGDIIAGKNPMGRIGKPSDMVGVTLYLASKASSYVNGVVIPIDGGQVIKANM